jgi:hypothetical protein
VRHQETGEGHSCITVENVLQYVTIPEYYTVVWEAHVYTHLSETHHISGCHAYKMSGITPHQHISTIIELVGQIQTQDTGLLIPVPTCAQENATAASGKANGITH